MTAPTNLTLADQIISRCRLLATFTETPGETTRTFLSPPMREVHAIVGEWMHSAGMTTRIDAIGNIRGLYPGPAPDSPRLLLISHLDTVPNAGAFDGPLGVILSLALIEHLHAHHTKLPYAIELVGFSEEEGVRFSKPFLSSLAVTGDITPEDLARTDDNGISVTQAIANFGLDPAQLPQARFSPHTFACLECHIEQGPILEYESVPIGIVTAIAGQTRTDITFTGQSNHAGTTPIYLRHDALAAAAEWITAVEAYSASHTDSLVATVGRIHVEPNATNVVPARVTASLDIRHAEDELRKRAVHDLIHKAHHAAERRKVAVTSHLQLEQPAVPMDEPLSNLLRDAADRVGAPNRSLHSGAGHDAMILAPHIPTTMLFLRSPNGLSHHPDESVLPEDVAAAYATALEVLSLLTP
jgi:allantoate deiminase